MTEFAVSIVIPTFNRRSSLERLLGALEKQSQPHDSFEVVVVDDGSADGTLEMLEALRPSFSLRVFPQPNGGPAAARNRGARNAQAPVLLFIDDDVVPGPDLIAAHMRRRSSMQSAVIIGPMLPPGDWSRPPWIRWEEEKLLEQYRDLESGVYECSPRQFYTGNASLPRVMFEQAGGFDIRFKRAEDVELAYRMRDRGAQFVFAPEAQVLHHPSRSYTSWSNTPYQYGRNDVIMFRELGHEGWPCTQYEFHQRHPLAQMLTRACVGSPLAVAAAVSSIGLVARGLNALGQYRGATLALSAVFTLQYWQGACTELGDRDALWRSVEQTRLNWETAA